MKTWTLKLSLLIISMTLSACSTLNTDSQTSTKKMTAEQSSAKIDQATGAKKANDKLLSLWRHFPSTQWFINDIKHEDIG